MDSFEDSELVDIGLQSFDPRILFVIRKTAIKIYCFASSVSRLSKQKHISKLTFRSRVPADCPARRLLLFQGQCSQTVALCSRHVS